MLWLLKGLGEGTGRRPVAKGEMLISSEVADPSPFWLGLKQTVFETTQSSWQLP